MEVTGRAFGLMLSQKELAPHEDEVVLNAIDCGVFDLV
jgi:hypothetical protein